MKKLIALLTLPLLVAACATQPAGNNDVPDQPGTFKDPGEEGPEELTEGPGAPRVVDQGDTEEARARWEWYTDVLKFRGVRMPKLLFELKSTTPDDWNVVREKVVPAPARPSTWPPQLVEVKTRTNKHGQKEEYQVRLPLSKSQEKYRDYLMWPKAIRQKLQAKDWNSAESRAWLVNQGHIYSLSYTFDTTEPSINEDTENERWRRYIGSMQDFGAEGQAMLISSMIIRLGHDQQEIVTRARLALVEIGPDAIQPLLDVLWVSMAGNANFNKNVVNTLADFRIRAVGPTISELIAEDSPRGGITWRSRKWFIELLGLLRDKRGILAISDEIKKTDITEYMYQTDSEGNPLRDMPTVKDPVGTATAIFTFHEYCINALGRIGDAEGLGPIIDLWEKDEDHMEGAVAAIRQIVRNYLPNEKNLQIRSPAEARAIAARCKKG